MTTVVIPPRLLSIIAEADRIAPNRRKTSDGTLGDARHRAEVSDHNPDARGVVHAVDLSQSMPGAPYWKPGYGQFDIFTLFRGIVARYRAASPAVRARDFGWLDYLVWFDAGLGYEVIFHPAAHGLAVVANGHPKIGHTEHGHTSINAGAASENDTRPIFGGAATVVTPPKPPPPPVTTPVTFEGEAAMQTDLSMTLDSHGNGYVDLPGVRAVDVHVAWPIGIPDPQRFGYAAIPRVSLTISPPPAAVARVVVEGGKPSGPATVRVVHT